MVQKSYNIDINIQTNIVIKDINIIAKPTNVSCFTFFLHFIGKNFNE